VSKARARSPAPRAVTHVWPVEVDVAVEHDVPELLPAARSPIVHVRRPVSQQPRLQHHERAQQFKRRRQSQPITNARTSCALPVLSRRFKKKKKTRGREREELTLTNAKSMDGSSTCSGSGAPLLLPRRAQRAALLLGAAAAAVERSERRRRHAEDTGEVHGCSHPPPWRYASASAVVLGCVTSDDARAVVCAMILFRLELSSYPGDELALVDGEDLLEC